MCYAVPGKILQTSGDLALVDFGGIKRKANVSLLDSPRRGDFVLIHAGFAIERLSAKDAEESLKMIRDSIRAAQEAD